MPIKRVRAKSWLQNVLVKPAVTFVPPGTYGKDAESIARTLASKRVSPNGLGSAIRTVQFFLNRSGSGISKTRRRELEKAKHLLQQRLRRKSK